MTWNKVIHQAFRLSKSSGVRLEPNGHGSIVPTNFQRMKYWIVAGFRDRTGVRLGLMSIRVNSVVLAMPHGAQAPRLYESMAKLGSAEFILANKEKGA